MVLIRGLRRGPSDDPRIKKLIASAEQFLERKDYTEARREVLRAQELAVRFAALDPAFAAAHNNLAVYK